MTSIWDMRDLSPVEKLALLALADWANDDGLAWPSIKQIADKTGCGERTVQRAFCKAESQGWLTREVVNGKGCKYNIHPRQCGTPASVAPPPRRHPTPARVAPNTSIHTIISKAKALPIARAKVLAEKPFDVSDAIWRDWLSHRKAKFTPTALDGFAREASKAGWTVEAALTESLERGWQGFKADWVKDKQNGNGRSVSNNRTGDGNGFRAALRQVSGSDFDGPWGDNEIRM